MIEMLSLWIKVKKIRINWIKSSIHPHHLLMKDSNGKAIFSKKITENSNKTNPSASKYNDFQ